MRVKSQNDELCLNDILQCIGKAKLSENIDELFKKHKIQYPANTYKEISKILGTTPYRVTKAIKLHLAKTRPEKRQLRRRPGRPNENLSKHRKALEFLTSEKTLELQRTLNRKERLEVYNSLGGTQVKLHTLRQFYIAKGIKMKYQRCRLGRPKLEADFVQFQQIELLRKKVMEYKQKKYDILLCDECVFSPNSYLRGRYWSLPNKQITVSKKYENQKPTACLAFLSKTRGIVQFSTEVMSYDADKFMQQILILREAYKKKKIAIFLDNCSIHRSKETQALCASLNPPIPLIFNLPYRPDLNDIELFWAVVKRQYRSIIAAMKISPIPYQNAAVVEHVMVTQKPEHSKKFWKLYKRVNQAQPIQKSTWEPNVARFTPYQQILASNDLQNFDESCWAEKI